MRLPQPLSSIITPSFCLVLTLVVGGGCARSVYRRQADREAYDLIGQKADRTHASTEDWGLQRDPSSRLFDVGNPDHPPMPEDDPLSHELMKTGGPKSAAAQPGAEPEEEWRKSLPFETKGHNLVVLNRRDAVEVAARNSRDFQKAREELYLTALDLSEERYEFAPHLDLGTTASRNEFGLNRKPGNRPKSNGMLDSTGGISLLTGWGTELVARVANTIVWDFDKPKLRTATSLLNFSIIQPLMRYGGRAYTLEALTQSERHLLGNVRRMEQYQQGFYLDVVAGRDATNGPARSENSLSEAPALLAGSPSGLAVVPRASGYLALLEDQQRIRNQESNVAGLQSSLDQLEAAFNAGRASSLLQVLQARIALQSSQSSLLSARAAYDTRVDTFKTDIGLPPNLPLAIRDALLDRFTVFDPATTDLQNRVNVFSGQLNDRDNPATADTIRACLEGLRKLQPSFNTRFAAARKDVVTFSETVPAREAQFNRLRQRKDLESTSINPARLDPKMLRGKAVQADQNLATLQKNVETIFTDLAGLERDMASLELDQVRTKASVLASSLSGYVLQLTLDHASSRIESITLPPIQLDERRAMDVAKANRLDWMNARAELVDAWRKIDYNANPLMSGLDLQLDGSLGTTKTSGTHFDNDAGTLQGSIHFDTPLDRLKERNDYREALVSYQRARRSYMLFEDRVSASLRNTLRLMDLAQLNFEIRRVAVQSALSEVDLAQLRLDEPPKPGQAAPQIGATAARDLVSALSDLLSAQNEFVSLWVGNEVLRMILDYELGLMEIDHDGHWVEPGPFTQDQLTQRLAHRTGTSEAPRTTSALPAPPAATSNLVSR